MRLLQVFQLLNAKQPTQIEEFAQSIVHLNTLRMHYEQPTLIQGTCEVYPAMHKIRKSSKYLVSYPLLRKSDTNSYKNRQLDGNCII